MNKDNLTDLPATSPLFLQHLTDTYGGGIQIKNKSQKSSYRKPKGFSPQKTEGSRDAATTNLSYFIKHENPAKKTEMVVY